MKPLAEMFAICIRMSPLPKCSAMTGWSTGCRAIRRLRSTLASATTECRPNTGSSVQSGPAPRSEVPRSGARARLGLALLLGGHTYGFVGADLAALTREAALERLRRMVDALFRATSYHGAFPHFIDGTSGATIRMNRKDDAADLVETSFLLMGLLCARQYFDEDTKALIGDGALINKVNSGADAGQDVLRDRLEPDRVEVVVLRDVHLTAAGAVGLRPGLIEPVP